MGLTDGSHCETCGEVIIQQLDMEVIPHNEIILEASEPTCTENGLTEGIYCDMCGTVFVGQQIVEATGHEERVVEGYPETCTTEGLTEGSVCGICGEELVVQEVIPAAGHSQDGEIVDEQFATCISLGHRTHYCGVCGELVTTEYEMLPHEDYDGDGRCDNGCQQLIN